MADQESIVKIMVESPKDPPNIEFGVASSQATTTVVQQKTDSRPQTEQIHIETSSSSSSSKSSSSSLPKTTMPSNETIIADIQEPIDVNTPRDTTNIFYAYEDVEFDNSINHQPSTSAIDEENNPTERRSSTNDRSTDIESESIEHAFVVHDEKNSSDSQTNQINNQNTQSSSWLIS